MVVAEVVDACLDLSAEVFKWFTRFARNNNVTLSEARKLLNSDELEEFKKDVNDYIEMGRANADGAFTKELENMSAKVHISRYESMLWQIKKISADVAHSEVETLDRYLNDTYQDTYLRNIYEFEKGTGIGVDFSRINENEVELLLDRPWAEDGKHFSERVWGEHRKDLVDSLNKDFRKMLVNGENPLDLAPKLQKRFDVTKYQAERLVHTESAYFAEEATAKSYDECGVEEYELIATLDYKTSEICRELDGKHYPVKKKQTGLNYPPFHPNCRTTTAPYIEDEELSKGTRIARDTEGNNTYVPADMDYIEWVESLDTDERSEFVKLRKINKNKKSDKRQYEKYRQVLGKENVPETIDKFRDLKYNDDKKEYEDLKHLYYEVSWQVRALENHTKGCEHRPPFNAKPNSVFDNYSEDGTLLQRRYYGRTGKPRLDIDMIDHGNPKKHPDVPHYHKWTWTRTRIGTGTRYNIKRGSNMPLEKWHIIANKDILRKEKKQ